MSASDLADIYTNRHVPSLPSVYNVFCLSKDEKVRPKSVAILHSNELTAESFSDVTLDDSNIEVVSPPQKYSWHKFVGWSDKNDNKPDGVALLAGDRYRPVVGRADFYPVFESNRVDKRPVTGYPRDWGSNPVSQCEFVTTDSKKRVLHAPQRSTVEADLTESIREAIVDEDVYNEAVAAGRLEIGLDCISSVNINIGKNPGKTGQMRGSISYCGGSTNLDYSKAARYSEGAPPGRGVWYSNTKRVYIPIDCTTISVVCREGEFPNLWAGDYKIDVDFVGLFYR